MKLDMTKGKPLRLIILFALPLFLSSVFQQFYNIADAAIVGHILGDSALSAVGAVSPVYNLVTSICFGLTNGFSILISKYFGAGDEKKMKQSIAGTMMLSLGLTAVLTVVCVLTIKPVLTLLNTPKDIYSDAYGYIIIIIACCMTTTFYNMLASIMRALGNSRIPLVFLIISSVLNIALDLFFIKTLDMGIKGAAWATVAAQLISGILCFIYIIRYCPALKLKKDDFRLRPWQIAELMSAGIAMSLMWAVVNLGTVILQWGINGFGENVIAGHVTARKISSLYMMLGATLSNTMSTFASQNYGAGKMHRVWEGVKTAHIISWIWAVAVIVITYIFADQMIIALTGTSNREIIDTGARYLKINLPFYFFLFELCIIRNTLQGIGCKVWPVVASIMEMAGKIITVFVFVKPYGYTAICYCEPFTWIICGIIVLTAFMTNKDIREILFSPSK